MQSRLRGHAHTRVRAVDGAVPAEVAARVRFAGVPANIAACTASHLDAIALAWRDGVAEALILEDDMTFELLDAWPEGWQRLRAAFPDDYGAVRLCVAETPRRLDALFRQRDALVPMRKLYWCAGAYVIDRAGMAALLDRFARGDHFDVADFDQEQDPEHVVFSGLQRSGRVAGPFDARVPLFIYEGEDSELHPEHLPRYRRARDFVLAHHEALRRGAYVSPWSARGLLSKLV